MLGNHPDQFEDLKMHNNTEVEGMKGGLDIKGSGTFKFHIKGNEGGVHHIKIPNSKYIPDLRVCLLLPHHWVQEAKNHHPIPKGTKTKTNNEALMLMWNQRRHRRTIPYHPLTNTPSFCTAPKPRKHSTTNRSTTSKCPANSTSTKNALLKRMSTTASSRNHLRPLREPRAMTSQYKQAKGDKEEEHTMRMGPLTFNVNPKLKEDKHVYLAAVNNQAKLMHWHYCLGHLAFSKLKQLALNGEIP
jgi:hypothetical protein